MLASVQYGYKCLYDSYEVNSQNTDEFIVDDQLLLRFICYHNNKNMPVYFWDSHVEC